MPQRPPPGIGNEAIVACLPIEETLRLAPDSPYDTALRAALQFIVLGAPPAHPLSSALQEFCAGCRNAIASGNFSALTGKMFGLRTLSGSEGQLARGVECVLHFLAVDFPVVRERAAALRQEQPDSAILAALHSTVLARTDDHAGLMEVLRRDLDRGVLTEFALNHAYLSLESDPASFLRVQAALARSLTLNAEYFTTGEWRSERLEVADAFAGVVRPSGAKLQLRAAATSAPGEKICAFFSLRPERDEELRRCLDAVRLLVTSDALVLSGEWLVRTSDSYLLNDLYTGTPHHRMSIYGRLGQSAGHAQLLIPAHAGAALKTACLVGGDRNYYHWIIDALPRLMVLQAAGCTDDVSLLAAAIDRPFQRDTLAALDMEPTRFHPCRYPETIAVKHLTVPLLGPQNRTFHPSYSALDVALHDAFGKRLVPDYATTPWGSNENGLRLFVLRGGGLHRRVVNESEVAEEFSRHGWTVIDCATLSVREQVGAFNRARSVVGIHGAALANTCFCRPGTAVTELAFPAWSPPYFGTIAAKRALRHRQLLMRCTLTLTRPDGFADGFIDPLLTRRILATSG